MTEDIRSNISVDLIIPSTRLKACAMDTMQSYKPLVEEALKEVRHDLNFDKEFQAQVKAAVKLKVQSIIEKAITESAKAAVDSAYYQKYPEIEKEVIKILRQG